MLRKKERRNLQAGKNIFLKERMLHNLFSPEMLKYVFENLLNCSNQQKRRYVCNTLDLRNPSYAQRRSSDEKMLGLTSLF